jgi:hypothetical protein
MLKLDTTIHRVEVVHTGPELTLVYAQLRADSEAAGHALAEREHNADCWIAATALRLRRRVKGEPGEADQERVDPGQRRI